MFKKALPLLLAGTLLLGGLESYAQLGDDKPTRPTDGTYLIKKIRMDDSILSAENMESKITVAAVFTFDPVPGEEKKPTAPPSKKGKRHAKKRHVRKELASPDDCKAWMMHVNWSPRVGDKVKVIDAGACHLKGSFAGR